MAGIGLRRIWMDDIPVVDWSNPLSTGLILCVPGNRLPLYDIVGNRTFTLTGSPVLNKPTPFGPGIETLVYNQGGYFSLPASDNLRVQPPATIGWAGYKAAASVQHGLVAGIEHNNSNSSPYQSLTFQTGTTYYVHASNDGTNIQEMVGFVTPTATLGKKVLVGVRGLSESSFWVDGVREGVLTYSGSIAYGTTAQLGVAAQFTSGRDPGTVLAVLAIWARELTRAEIGSFNLDPTQLFRSVRG